MAKNPEGWVDIELILSYQNVQYLTQDQYAAGEALRGSRLLVVKADYTQIKRRENPPNIEDLGNRTVVAQGFPIQSTIKEVSDLFGQFGQIGDGFAKIVFKRKESADVLVQSKIQPVFKKRQSSGDEISIPITVESSKIYLERQLALRPELNIEDQEYSTQAILFGFPHSESINEQIILVFQPYNPKQIDEVQLDQISEEEFAIITFGTDSEAQHATDSLNYANLKIHGVVIRARKWMKWEDEEMKNLKDVTKFILINNLPQECKRNDVLKVFPPIDAIQKSIKNIQVFHDNEDQRQFAVAKFEEGDHAKVALYEIRRIEKFSGKIKFKENELQFLFCNEGKYRRLMNVKMAEGANMVLQLIDTPTNTQQKVILYGMHPNTTRQSIMDQIREFNPSKIKFIENDQPTKDIQVAEVQFNNLLDAQRVVKKMNQKPIDGIVIRAFIDGNIMQYNKQASNLPLINTSSSSQTIPLIQQPSIIIKNISNTTQEQNIRNILPNIQLTRISFQPDLDSATGARIAVVEFKDSSSASQAQKRINGTFQFGKTLQAEILQPVLQTNSSYAQSLSEEVISRSVFIGGVPHNVSRQEIFDAFQEPKPNRVQMGELKQKQEFAGYFYAVFQSIEEREQILNKMNRQIRLQGKIFHMKRFGEKEDDSDANNNTKSEDSKSISQSNKLRISNLPRNVTSEQLKDAFKQFGEVECAVALDSTQRQSLGFGFANFATPAQALAARDALNGRNIFGEGRAMKITFARISDEEKAKLYVANLPPNITPLLLRQQFQKYGIRDIWISRPRNISRSGKQIQQGRFAFIVLNDEKEVQHAISEQNNFNLSGWRMKVDRAVSKEDQMNQRSSSSQQSDADKKIDDLERSVRDKERDVHILQDQLKRQRQKLELKEIDLQIQQAGSDASELHVTGLGTQTTSEELLQHFKEFGAVRGYVINNPQTRQSRGYGFVAFLKQEDALNALNELNGSLINDKSINIDQSRNPQKFDYNIDLKKISDNIQQIEQDLAKAEEKVVAAKRELQTAKELPKQGAPDNNQEEELCPILGEILSEVESCECSAEKGHRLCCDCLKESLESDLHGYKLNLRCIVDPTCQAEYDMDLIERILDQRELLRIQELQAMEAGRNLTVTQNVQVRVQQQNFKTEEERKNAEIQEFRNLIVQTMTEALAEVCPKCKRAIIKEAGCNLITCPCRTCFCYNCGIDITVITYSHFNKGSNPCPLNVNDNTRINTDRQRRKARDAAEKFMQTHPRFDKVEERLNEYFKEFLD